VKFRQSITIGWTFIISNDMILLGLI